MTGTGIFGCVCPEGFVGELCETPIGSEPSLHPTPAQSPTLTASLPPSFSILTFSPKPTDFPVPSTPTATTPGPTLFEGGYDLVQCSRDVVDSDLDSDGFLSRDEEFLLLINRIGAGFCFSQTAPLTATQNGEYFRIVCDLTPDCRFDSEIPVTGLTEDQLMLVCLGVRQTIFTTCPESTPVPSPTTLRPSWASQTSPEPSAQGPSTPSPTFLGFEPVAPGVTVSDCLSDLASVDSNDDHFVSAEEFLAFLITFGERFCYTHSTGEELTLDESQVFYALVALTDPDMAQNAAIDLSVVSSSGAMAYTLCTVTHTVAMNAPHCASLTANPTSSPGLDSNSTAPADGCTIDCGENGNCRTGTPRPGSEAFHYWYSPDEVPDPQFCECLAGFGGKYCDAEGQDCGDFTCLNGGSCFDSLGQPMVDRCNCLNAWEPGFEALPNIYYDGRFCQYPSTDVCFESDDEAYFCTNFGQCNDNSSFEPCDCPIGYTGFACEFLEGTECVLDCGDYGVCRLGNPPGGSQAHTYWYDPFGEGSYQYCECDSGYGGKFCDYAGEDCGAFICLNGGTCDPSLPDRCNCLDSWEEGSNGEIVYYDGRFCQYASTSICYETESETIFCANGGLCSSDPYDGCTCPNGFTGFSCEFVEGTDCTLDCRNGGTCRLGTPPNDQESHQYCVCTNGYEGSLCEAVVADGPTIIPTMTVTAAATESPAMATMTEMPAVAPPSIPPTLISPDLSTSPPSEVQAIAATNLPTTATPAGTSTHVPTETVHVDSTTVVPTKEPSDRPFYPFPYPGKFPSKRAHRGKRHGGTRA